MFQLETPDLTLFLPLSTFARGLTDDLMVDLDTMETFTSLCARLVMYCFQVS